MFQTPLHACGTNPLDVGIILPINPSPLEYKYPISTWMSEIISMRDPISSWILKYPNTKIYERMIHQMHTFIQDITNFNTITDSIINTIMDIHVFIIKLYTYIIITKLSIKHKHHRQLFITTRKATSSHKA